MDSESGLNEFFSETLTMSDVVSYEGSSGSGDVQTVTVKTITDPLTGYTLLAIGELLEGDKQGMYATPCLKEAVGSIALSCGPCFVGWADNRKSKKQTLAAWELKSSHTNI